MKAVSREIGVGMATLERWRAEALSLPASTRAWTAAARLEAVISTAALDEAEKSAWCRRQGLYPSELEKWHQSATGRAGRGARQPAADPARPAAHQGTGARGPAQRQGAGRDHGVAGAVKKTRGDLQGGRGRMIRLNDRQQLAQDIEQAHSAGARLKSACELAGIDVRTL